MRPTNNDTTPDYIYCLTALTVTLSIRQAASFLLSRDPACGLHLGSSMTGSEMCWCAAAAAAAAGAGAGGGCCLCRYTVIDRVFDISVVSVWNRH